jgi:TatD DNase family protein
MIFTDTHCHIHSAGYPIPIEEVDAHCQEANVAYLLCVGTNAEDSKRAVNFVQDRPTSWASIGLHPHEAKDGQTALDELRAVITDAKRQKIVAIGECGLDYFYRHSSKKDQEKALRFQIELALEHDLPLIFHVREAFDDFWPIFDSYDGIRGELHSFTDHQNNLDKALTRQLFIGVNGIMTFTKHDWQLEIAKTMPLERLLLETDAPFLTPMPLRGKVNEPARVRLVAEFLANLRHISLQELAAITTVNARQLFSIPKSTLP